MFFNVTSDIPLAVDWVRRLLRPNRLRVALTALIALLALFLGLGVQCVLIFGAPIPYPVTLWFSPILWPLVPVLKGLCTRLCNASMSPLSCCVVKTSLMKPGEACLGLVFLYKEWTYTAIAVMALVHIPYWYVLASTITAAARELKSRVGS